MRAFILYFYQKPINRLLVFNLLNCFEKVDELLEKNDNVDIIYLDFQKAFDSVPHKRLMHKLKMYGITGKTLAIISDFLKDRTF